METNTQTHLQAATVQDESVLWLMPTFAAWMESGGEEQIAQARSDPYLSTYVSGWGARKGDLGVIARDGIGEVLGAVWLRLGGADGPLNLGDKHVPELATAVVPRARWRGVGTAMIKHLIELASPCYPRIILSVREENPAVLFYSKLGFREVSRMENRVGGSSLIMTMDLAHAAREQNSVGGILKA
jgi:ribosomal protein S18 acetylase RimI-like enzyme